MTTEREPKDVPVTSSVSVIAATLSLSAAPTPTPAPIFASTVSSAVTAAPLTELSATAPQASANPFSLDNIQSVQPTFGNQIKHNGYSCYENPMNRGFISFGNFSEIGKGTKEGEIFREHGLKFHISLSEDANDQRKRGWDIIVDVLIRNNVRNFKIFKPGENISEIDPSQRGKDITIYAHANPEKSVAEWEAIFTEITEKLAHNNISPGYRSQGTEQKPEKPLSGSNYISYRYCNERLEQRGRPSPWPAEDHCEFMNVQSRYIQSNPLEYHQKRQEQEKEDSDSDSDFAEEINRMKKPAVSSSSASKGNSASGTSTTVAVPATTTGTKPTSFQSLARLSSSSPSPSGNNLDVPPHQYDPDISNQKDTPKPKAPVALAPHQDAAPAPVAQHNRAKSPAPESPEPTSSWCCGLFGRR